jgi:hypothetical protein
MVIPYLSLNESDIFHSYLLITKVSYEVFFLYIEV